MSNKLLVFTLLVASLAPVLSQELKKSERTCRLVFPEKPRSAPNIIYLYDGKDNHEVYVSPVNFSDVVKLKTGDVMLYIAPEPITDPENINPAYPKLAIPESVRNFYIFLSLDRKNKVMPLKMNLVNIDDGKFNLGDTLWYNFTGHRIAAKLGESKMSVAAGKSSISKPPLSADGYYKAEFVFQPNSTGPFRRITEQKWWFDADCRYVGFIANRGGRLPLIYFFRDFRSKIKPEPEPEAE